jgi:hypothetical protein
MEAMKRACHKPSHSPEAYLLWALRTLDALGVLGSIREDYLDHNTFLVDMTTEDGIFPHFLFRCVRP